MMHRVSRCLQLPLVGSLLLLLLSINLVQAKWTNITYESFEYGFSTYGGKKGSDANVYWENGTIWLGSHLGDQSSLYLREANDLSRFKDLQLSFWMTGSRRTVNVGRKRNLRWWPSAPTGGVGQGNDDNNNDDEYRDDDQEGFDDDDDDGIDPTPSSFAGQNEYFYDSTEAPNANQTQANEIDPHSLVVEYQEGPGKQWQRVYEFLLGKHFVYDTRSLAFVKFSLYGDFNLTSQGTIRFRCKLSALNDGMVGLEGIHLQGLDRQPSPDTSVVPASTTTIHDSLCPLNRTSPPSIYTIEELDDPIPDDDIEDDIYEVSSMVFSDQTDAYGNRYAYIASDKEQYSLKVIQFNRSNRRGRTVAKYTLFTEKPKNDDWEDISLGPCTDIPTTAYNPSEVCIYIGSIGNNHREVGKPRRRELSLYKFKEPKIGPSGPYDQIVPYARIGFRYGDGFRRYRYYDAEALFVDWTGVRGNPEENAGDIYVVTKHGCRGGVGKIPISAHRELAPGESLWNYNMVRVVKDPPMQSNNATCRDDNFDNWRGADMRRDGGLIALVHPGSQAKVQFFPRAQYQSVADALRQPPCPFAAFSDTTDGLSQFEAVSFLDITGSRIAEMTECSEETCSPPVYLSELVYPSGSAN